MVFGAGLLLGMLARAAGTLWFGILGHWFMYIGLFLYWWTQVAGTFGQQPIFRTGIDEPFIWECASFAAALAILLRATSKLLSLRNSTNMPPLPGLAAAPV